MASFWFWLFTILLSCLAGGMIMLILFGAFAFVKDLFVIKKGIETKDKKAVSQFIQVNKQKLSFAGKPEKPTKEQEEKEENDRRAKVREFEKLRRIESRTRESEQLPRDTPGVKELSAEGLLPHESSKSDRESGASDGTAKKRVKLDG